MGLWLILYGAVGLVTAVTVMALTAPSADASPDQQHQEAADSVTWSLVIGLLWPLMLLAAAAGLAWEGLMAGYLSLTRRAHRRAQRRAETIPTHRYTALASQQRALAAEYRRLGETDLADGAEALAEQYLAMARLEELETPR